MSSFRAIEKYGVVGYPIEHSLSPPIHHGFAEQLGHCIDYQKYSVASDGLESFVRNFFSAGGKGLNLTLPHKYQAAAFTDWQSPLSQCCGSINTLYLNDAGQLCGDSTDGKGLMLDLSCKGLPIVDAHILILGAGGATQSILYSLLQSGARVSLYNRSQDKVNRLIEAFSKFGQVSEYSPRRDYLGVFSALTEFEDAFLAPVATSLAKASYVYDLNYGERSEALRDLCERLGQSRFFDGWGMLIAQAALSYQIWTGVLPDFQSHVSA